MYNFRRGQVVNFKAGKRSALMCGKIETVADKKVWIKLLYTKHKFVKEDQQATLCIHKSDIMV